LKDLPALSAPGYEGEALGQLLGTDDAASAELPFADAPVAPADSAPSPSEPTPL
jgi:hypothetical protein